ncbi:MAG TPA: hypothetical protein VGW79_08555 [Actinomycetota bacterium]|nr:hypothetical protein [Actinomycetota bacterium]
MARAPSSGPAGAILKLPAPLIKAVLVLGVVGSTLGATLFVATVTGASPVRIPLLAGPSYARDVTGFHPISSHTPSPHTSTQAPPGKTGSGPTPPTTPSHATSPTPTQAPTPSETPPQPAVPSLSVAIASPSQSVRKKGTITYTIIVTNTGSGTASNVVIESHVPDGASLSSWLCDGKTVQAKGASSFTCGTVGSAPAPNHPLVFAVPSLAPGASAIERFAVTVDPNVKHNSAIVDHAHAYAVNADLADSNIVSVVVR